MILKHYGTTSWFIIIWDKDNGRLNAMAYSVNILIKKGVLIIVVDNP